MKKLFLLPLLAIGMMYPQDDLNNKAEDIKLPNGKSQREEILKAEHQKTLQDAAELVKLSEQLQDELIKEDRHVLSLANLKRVDDIEKLARRIRSRLRK